MWGGEIKKLSVTDVYKRQVEDIEKDNPNGDAHHFISGPLAEGGHTATDFGNPHFINTRAVSYTHLASLV